MRGHKRGVDLSIRPRFSPLSCRAAAQGPPFVRSLQSAPSPRSGTWQAGAGRAAACPPPWPAVPRGPRGAETSRRGRAPV